MTIRSGHFNCKRVLSMLLALAIMVSTVTILFPNQVLAATKGTAVKTLKLNKTYSLDLNGGSKEKVKLKNVGDNWTLIVNGKRVYSNIGSAFDIKYLDIDTSDKYKELLVESDPWGGFSQVTAVRYYSKNKVKAYVCDHVNAFTSLAGVKNTGKNKFYLDFDTPYRNSNYGMYHIKRMPVKISGSMIVSLKKNTYELGDYFITSDYILNKSMKLYPKASRKNAVSTLKAGTTFKATRVKIGTRRYNGYNYEYDLYVKVKASNGKTGWLYFPALKEYNGGKPYLVNPRGWA